MKNECVVTGASSQIGQVLLDQLSERFLRVQACSRRAGTGSGNRNGNVTWRLADLETDYVVGPETTHLIHLAPLYLLERVLAAAPQPLRVIGISTCSVLHKAQSTSTAERKLAAELGAAEEQAIATAGRKGHQLTLLRPTMLYGVGRDGTVGVLQKFASRFGFLVIPGNAQGLRQPVHVGDVAQAVLLCLEQAETIGRTYEIGGLEQMTVCDMCKKILQDNGKQVRVFHIPMWALKGVIAVARGLRIRPDWDVALLERAKQDQTVDNCAAIYDFGYAPRSFDGATIKHKFG